MDKKIFSEVKDNIGIVWLNRPEKKNALNDELWFGLPELVKELDENEKMISRADMFSSPKELDDLYLKIDQISLKNNSFFGWIKSKLLPNKNN